ncbi:hypothetical protein A2U01_0086711, partial [Trifolium medium]|nr:hypothetical protein [Trifolium medium]
FTLLTLSPPV